MILAIDIGNSFTKFGFFENNLLIRRLAFPTERHRAVEFFNSDFDYAVSAIIISSVVPELENAYLEWSQKHFNLAPFFVDNSFDFKLKIKYESAEKLGTDRLIAALAAVEKYGKPCLVCDFGTATTIDAINESGDFLGGIIAPGMDLLAESLNLKTAKLPRVEIAKPAKVIGNSTIAAIQSGIYFGYIGLVDGLVTRMLGELNEPARIIATGGFARIIAESSGKIELVDDNLMLEGLRFIYESVAHKIDTRSK